jgi:hypothetical protein
MFDDQGPFGWNDPCNFQDDFNKAKMSDKIAFIEKVTSGR